MADSLLDRAGRWLARFLATESAGYQPYTPSDPETLAAVLRPGDILLVEGNQRVSAAIKYLTQSTWSHAAFYIGDRLAREGDSDQSLIECSVEAGCAAVPLAKYRNFNTASIRFTCHAISTRRPISRWSSRPSSAVSTTRS